MASTRTRSCSELSSLIATSFLPDESSLTHTSAHIGDRRARRPLDVATGHQGMPAASPTFVLDPNLPPSSTSTAAHRGWASSPLGWGITLRTTVEKNGAD